MGDWKADQRLYLTEDGQVVTADKLTSGTLLAPAGAVVPDAVCRKYGLGPYAAPVEAPAPSPQPAGKPGELAEPAAADGAPAAPATKGAAKAKPGKR